MTSIATELRLKPQAKRVLSHLRKRGSISPIEAQSSYGIFRLAASVCELRKAGYKIDTHLREDEGGHGYARYTMKETMQ